MDVKTQKELQIHIEAISKILYENCQDEELNTLTDIEKTVRNLMHEHIGPQMGFFLPKK